MSVKDNGYHRIGRLYIPWNPHQVLNVTRKQARLMSWQKVSVQAITERDSLRAAGEFGWSRGTEVKGGKLQDRNSEEGLGV